jgi:hypothetical protein
MKERLLAELDARIARHAAGDSSGVVGDQVLDLVTELTALGEPDAGSLVRVAALHLCRYAALPPEDREVDLRLARALYIRLHQVDPRLVAPEIREFFGLESPRDGAAAHIRAYERTGLLDHLDRAISLFRQEMLEQRADGRLLAAALRLRHERTGRQADLDEAIELAPGPRPEMTE